MAKRGPETPVEQRLKWLEGFGFEVLKLTCPGFTGVPDRMILWPTWSPAPPTVVECKAPNKTERERQGAIRIDWTARGVDVRKPVTTEDEAIALCDTLLITAFDRAMSKLAYSRTPVPVHILHAYKGACQRRGYAQLIPAGSGVI